MKILAVETSCDETAAAVVRDGRHMLSNVVASQVEEHKLYGGVVPEIASRRHAEIISDVVRQALSDANTPVSDIDALAVTHYPVLSALCWSALIFKRGSPYQQVCLLFLFIICVRTLLPTTLLQSLNSLC